MDFTKEQILEHYRIEAERHGVDGTSTIQDIRTRTLEIQAIFGYLRDGMKILEVGCGNGYMAEQIVSNFAVELEAIDFSAEMIELAMKRQINPKKGSVSFSCKDILTLKVIQSYDLVFTDRCLQNLTSWGEQKKALSNISQAIKTGGEFVMLESFDTGQNFLNAARSELDLPEISPPWHNLFFNENTTKKYMAEHGCHYIDQNTFLSGYYFGSRIILPAIMPKGKTVTSQSPLNDYFCHFPPYGDFCPMKILHFKKGE